MRLAFALVAVVACKGDPAPAPRPGSSDEPIRAKFVDELVPSDHGRELRVAGTIEGPLTAVVGSGDERTISFGLVHNGKHLRVIHTGVLPDRFREHFDAAAQGRWLDAGEARPILIARGLPDAGDVFDAREVFVSVPDFK